MSGSKKVIAFFYSVASMFAKSFPSKYVQYTMHLYAFREETEFEVPWEFSCEEMLPFYSK